MHEIIKPCITLFMVTLISSVSLAVVNGVTKEPIARQKLLARNAAMQELLPTAKDFTEATEISKGAGVKTYFTGHDVDGTAGYIVSTSPTGYAGPIDLLIAVGTDGVLVGVRVVGHSETPGLGSLAEEESFTNQYIGKSGQLSVTRSGNPGPQEIDTLSGATVTTRAVTDGVNNALTFFEQNLKGAVK